MKGFFPLRSPTGPTKAEPGSTRKRFLWSHVCFWFVLLPVLYALISILCLFVVDAVRSVVIPSFVPAGQAAYCWKPSPLEGMPTGGRLGPGA